MADLPTIVKLVALICAVVTCIYLFCYYFPLIETTNHDLPVKITSPATSPATNYRRFRFVPADSPKMVKSPAMNISSPRSEKSCPSDNYAADDESCSEACSIVSSPDDMLLEKVGPDLYVPLKVYEQAFEDLDKMNLRVQLLVRERCCTKKHLKLYEEKLKYTINMNTKLKDVILLGLKEKHEYALYEQLHLEFTRINFKFRKLVGDYYEK